MVLFASLYTLSGKTCKREVLFFDRHLGPLMTVKYWCGNTAIICMWLLNSIAEVYWPD